MKCLQNTGGMCDDQQRTVGSLTEQTHALGYDTDSIDIQAGIGLIQDGQLRLQHQHLQNLGFLLLAAGETDIQIALRIRFIHMQQSHRLLQFLFKVPQTKTTAGLLLQRAANKGA